MMSLVMDYKFVLRKYAAFTIEASQVDKLVLYAMPVERKGEQ